MDLRRTDEETMLQDSARRMLDDIAPISRLRRMRDDQRRSDPDLWAQMVQAGWSGVLIGENAGGNQMGHAAALVLAEEMGRTLAVSPFISTALIAATALQGAGAQDALTAIAEDGQVWALALDEGRKFDPSAVALRAERSGNGFRLSGRKSIAMDAGSADRLLVVARTSGQPGDTAGLTLFIVASDAPGLTRTELDLIDHRDAAQLDFANVEAAEPLGDLDQGWRLLAPALSAGQAALAAEMTGAAAATAAMTTAYLKDRRQFGVPIGSFQALQHRAAHLWSELELTTSTILHAARKLDEAPDDAALAASLAKARATATLQLAVQEGVQMHGGIGMTDDFDMGFFMRRARVCTEWLGDYGWHAQQIARMRGL